MGQDIILRDMVEADCQLISAGFASQGWDKPVEPYAGYFQEQNDGKREVIIAEFKGEYAGYVTIVWRPNMTHSGTRAYPK